LNTSFNWSYAQDVTDLIEHEISEGAMGGTAGLATNRERIGARWIYSGTTPRG
jgi:hypothetical protein